MPAGQLNKSSFTILLNYVLVWKQDCPQPTLQQQGHYNELN